MPAVLIYPSCRFIVRYVSSLPCTRITPSVCGYGCHRIVRHGLRALLPLRSGYCPDYDARLRVVRFDLRCLRALRAFTRV